MDKNAKLKEIKERFIKMEQKEKEERAKKNKEEIKETIIMIIIFAILSGISVLLTSLGFFVTKLIGFIMFLGLLGYICIFFGDD